MRILYPTINRNDVLSRNPLMVRGMSYLSALPPHTLTSRATYNPPAGRMAYFQLTNLLLFRYSAATTAGLQQAFVQIDNGSSIVTTHLVFSWSNVVGAGDRNTAQGAFYVTHSDTLTFFTADASTGGTVEYVLALLGIEFDA